MSLFERQPIIEHLPETSAADYIVTVKQMRSGREILLCTAATLPAEVIAEAAAKGLPLFTGNEIMRLRDCDPEMIEQILAVKTTFPGSTVMQIISGAVQV